MPKAERDTSGAVQRDTCLGERAALQPAAGLNPQHVREAVLHAAARGRKRQGVPVVSCKGPRKQALA